MQTSDSEWQIRRDRFNHDWLKNQYLTALARFLNVLEGRIEDDRFEVHFVAEILPRWEGQYPLALALIAECEDAMSPRRLFGQAPLLHWPVQKSWLPNLVHGLWRGRCQIAKTISRSHVAAVHANRIYWQLTEALDLQSVEISPQLLQALCGQFVEFRDSCLELAKAIESFPRNVLIT